MNPRSPLGSVGCMLTALAIMTISRAASGQMPGGAGGTIRPCAAASCEDVSALVSALDTVLRANSECSGQHVLIEENLYWDPYAFDEESGREEGLAYPAIGKWGNRGSLALRIYSSRISLIDLRRAANARRAACSMVFSPPTWLGPDSARVIVALLGSEPQQRVEWYVFLSRSKVGWDVDRVEAGRQR